MNTGNRLPEGPEEKKQKPLYTSGMDKKKMSRLRVRCPCCEAVLTVERSNGCSLQRNPASPRAVRHVLRETAATDSALSKA